MAQIDLTRRTKIVATIGPATESPERIRELIQAGATTFRLNFSHGDHSEHAERIATIRQVAHELGSPHWNSSGSSGSEDSLRSVRRRSDHARER
jgi:hypothetical protein